MNWFERNKNYFVFNRKDRVAILFFLVLMASVAFMPYFFNKSTQKIAIVNDPLVAEAYDSIQQKRSVSEDKEEVFIAAYQEPSEAFTAGELFNFDPNTISLEGLRKLGLDERTTKTINNYRTKGGKFYKPEDLKKIWGLKPEFYERVKKYIVIETKPVGHTSPYTANKVHIKEERKVTLININEADTTTLIALPGIGSKLSARIVAFREKLGGFYSVDQVGETFGLPDSTFQRIKSRLVADQHQIKKINVNTVTKDELKLHPYFKWNLANAIVEYRNQHGAFKQVDDLKKIVLIDEATFDKIAPYLTIE